MLAGLETLTQAQVLDDHEQSVQRRCALEWIVPSRPRGGYIITILRPSLATLSTLSTL